MVSAVRSRRHLKLVTGTGQLLALSRNALCFGPRLRLGTRGGYHIQAHPDVVQTCPQGMPTHEGTSEDEIH